ncbi:MAG: cyclodeaminase/cyclohydrolase family protein [Eggerthellaceae bacterium]|jgi:formiminotetrahydrofolate cyclodeaminase
MDREFVESLASGDPTPGGGAACAYVGVLSTCLSSMVGNLTVGRDKYADVQDQATEQLENLKALRGRFEELVDEDQAAFEVVSNAYKMPHDTEEEKAKRSEVIQQALYHACEVPLEIMRVSLEVAEAARFFAFYGNRSVLSDAGTSASLARAAAHGACLTVIVNVRSMKNWNRAHTYELEMKRLLKDVDECTDAVEDYVIDRLSD